MMGEEDMNKRVKGMFIGAIRHVLRWKGKLHRPMYALLCLTFVSMLGGCMYPNDLKGQNQVPPGEYIALVQQAVEIYQKNTGVFPIKNYTEDTPLYERNVIDFRKLKERNFLSLIPGNAFENGGQFYYVLVHPDTDPLVKLMDLEAYQQAADVQKKVDDFKSAHHDSLPSAGQAADGFYWIDYGKLRSGIIQVKSVFSQAYLNLMMNKSGTVYIDYAPDLMTMLQKESVLPPADKDLRELLVERSNFVPVKSQAYYWKNGEPEVKSTTP